VVGLINKMQCYGIPSSQWTYRTVRIELVLVACSSEMTVCMSEPHTAHAQAMFILQWAHMLVTYHTIMDSIWLSAARDPTLELRRFPCVTKFS